MLCGRVIPSVPMLSFALRFLSANDGSLATSSRETQSEIRTGGGVPLVRDGHGLGVEIVQGQLILERRDDRRRVHIDRDRVRAIVQGNDVVSFVSPSYDVRSSGVEA